MKILFNESTKILSNSSLKINQTENVLPSDSLENRLKIDLKRGLNSDFETISFSSQLIDIGAGFIFNLNNSFTFLTTTPITEDIKNALISKHKNSRNTVGSDQSEYLFELAPNKKLKN